MKKLKELFHQNYHYLIVAVMVLGVTSCSKNDESDSNPDTNATGSIVVNDQTISQNKIVVESVTTDQDGWLVARNTSGGNTSAVVSDTVAISAGTTQNVELTLNNTASLTGNDAGDQFTITLYQDNPNSGTQGEFDMADTPVKDSNGDPVSETITVMAPSFKVQDQTVTDNAVNFDSVNTLNGGFIVLYNQNADGSINQSDIVGTTYVNPGTTDAVSVPFNSDFTYTVRTEHLSCFIHR